jgi:hypothetical protein
VKRSREAAAESAPWSGGVFAPGALDQGRGHLRALFESAKPFPHLSVSGIFDDALMRAAKRELEADNQEFFRKKTDLYDFVQSDSLKLLRTQGAIKAIHDALYGDEFRGWIEVRAALAFAQRIWRRSGPAGSHRDQDFPSPYRHFRGTVRAGKSSAVP